MKISLILSLLILFVSSCSSVHIKESDSPSVYREIANDPLENECSTIVSRIMGIIPSKESARAFVARTYKKYSIDPKVVNLQGTVYKMKDESGFDVEFELGKKLGHGYNGSVYVLKNQQGILAEEDIQYPFVVKMSNRYKAEKDLTVPGKHDKSLETEYIVEDFFRAQIERLWANSEMDQFRTIWAEPKLPLAIAYKKLKSKNGVFLIKPLVRGMFLGDIVKAYGKKASDLPSEMKQSLKDIYDFAQFIHKKVIVPGKLTGKETDQGFSLDLKPENLVWVHEPAAMEYFGLKKPSFVFVEFSHYAGGDWAYHQEKVSFPDYFKVFLNYLSSNSD